MCPRKSRYRIPQWKVQRYRSRGNQILFGPYYCPKCREKTLKININNKEESVEATCNCGFEHSFRYRRIYDPIDYYNDLIDRFKKTK